MSSTIRWKYDILGIADPTPGHEKKWRVGLRPFTPSKPALFSSDDIEECKAWIEKQELEEGYAQEIISGMTDEQRLELFRCYCQFCGCKEPWHPEIGRQGPGCQCWNDE
jgi:hypothetical protein